MKLVLLNGSPGIGKSTIAKKYVEEHSLTLHADGDAIVVMMGQWLRYENAARHLTFEHLKNMTAAHLRAGYDVVLPYLVLDVTQAEVFEAIAGECGAEFFEVLLVTDKVAAMRRLMKRGTWGEADLPPLTKKDVAEIEHLYDKMERVVAERPKTIEIEVENGKVADTYQRFLSAVS